MIFPAFSSPSSAQSIEDLSPRDKHAVIDGLAALKACGHLRASVHHSLVFATVRDAERIAYLLQSAPTNAIDAFFVFLDLLECEPDRGAELLLNSSPNARSGRVSLARYARLSAACQP